MDGGEKAGGIRRARLNLGAGRVCVCSGRNLRVLDAVWWRPGPRKRLWTQCPGMLAAPVHALPEALGCGYNHCPLVEVRK